MKGSEKVPSSEEAEGRSPKPGDKIQMLVAGVEIREIANGVAYFSHMREQLRVSVDRLIPVESGGWGVKDLQEIHDSCKKGTQTCGNCKKHAVELMEKMLNDLQEKREKSKNKIKQYLQ